MKRGKEFMRFIFVLSLAAFLLSGCQDSDNGDDSAIPINKAGGVSFTDTDTEGSGELGGAVSITKATDESDITHYELYWGKESSDTAGIDDTLQVEASTTAKIDSSPLIAEIAKTGSDLSYDLSADTSTPSGATHLLVLTKNETGEMSEGVSQAITDKMSPTEAAASVAFTDTDGNSDELGGTITVTKASDEDSLTHYTLYWGSSSTEKISSNSLITEIAKTGSDVTHDVSADTSTPSGATHILAFTKNSDAEMSSGVNAGITDRTVPYNKAAGLSAAADGDASAGQYSGDVTITAASNENDITHYVLYWASSSDNTSKLDGEAAITTIAKTDTLTYTIPINTDVQDGARSGGNFYLVVYTKNSDGEMSSGIGTTVADNTGDEV